VYAASFGLVIVALITLIIGVFQSGLTFIWVSIGSSVLAALFLAVGVLQKKPVSPATAGAPYGPPPGSPEPVSARGRAAADEEETLVEAPAPARRRSATAPASRAAADEETAPRRAPARRAPAEKAPAKRPAAKAAPAKASATAAKGAAKKPAAKAAATGGQVLAIPERGTYHQSTCRFVKGRRDTEKMTKAAASRKGFTACGVCRP
jgi:hypothetical protein